ncbi:hypothetical protein [Reichenbachiella sp.]|uniref:hypothetical protein n=1 Tax=Reichenbachiella sp. TaxID=2184521 RepID=UPI003BB0CD7A
MSNHVLYAQDEDFETRVDFKRSFWFDFGFGGGGQGSSSASGLGNEVDVKFNISQKLYMSIAYEQISFDSGRDLEYLKSTSFRIGRLYKRKVGVFYYGIGPSYVRGSRYVANQNGGRYESFDVASLTPQTGFLLSPGHVGIGFHMYGQINKEYSYIGMAVTFGLGVINERKKTN